MNLNKQLPTCLSVAAAIAFSAAALATGYLANPRSKDVAKALSRYEAVFVGQVIELKLVRSGDPFPEPGKPIPVSGTIVTFRVLRDFKDPKEPGVAESEKARLGYPFDDVHEKQVTIHALSAPAFDQDLYPFELGREYLVWANRRTHAGESRLELFEYDRPLEFPSPEGERELDALVRLTRSASEQRD